MRGTTGFKRLGLSIVLPILFAANSACGNEPRDTIIPTDYSNADHWLSLPAPVKEVDVFYIYPTAWLKVNKSDPDICALDNASMLEGSRILYAWQASAFEPVCNIYAPYYRQADAAYILSNLRVFLLILLVKYGIQNRGILCA